MIRRDFLRRVLYGGTALAATRATGRALTPRMNHDAALALDSLKLGSSKFDPWNLTGADQQDTHSLPLPTAIPFRLEDVRILDPDLLRMREQTLNYALALDSDRLLHNFRVNAKLPSAAEPLYNRESPTNGWRGHYVGHFLSACSQMYASTGDVRIKTKAAAMVSELAKCQAQLGDKGYLSAFPESGFDDLEQGRPAAVVWYALHKIMAGLLDVNQLMQNPQALQVLEGMAAWTDWRTGRLPEEQMQRTLQIEFGGMNEVLANLSGVTGNPRYLAVAKRFDHHAVMDPAAEGRDTLTTLHANTQIPKFIGAAREFELTGDPHYRDAAKFFWQQVALHRSYVTGGNSASEHFRTPPDVLASELTDLSQETCNTYNMLKLTRQLFTWQAEPQYADYYERAFLNHILATPNPADGSPLYYLGMQSGQWKVHFVPHEGFFCCCGTGLENFSKLSEGFYFHNEQSLWVNLFFASEVNWRDKRCHRPAGNSLSRGSRDSTGHSDEIARSLHIERSHSLLGRRRQRHGQRQAFPAEPKAGTLELRENRPHMEKWRPRGCEAAHAPAFADHSRRPHASRHHVRPAGARRRTRHGESRLEAHLL
jgi:hypothetical protein